MHDCLGVPWRALRCLGGAPGCLEVLKSVVSVYLPCYKGCLEMYRGVLCILGCRGGPCGCLGYFGKAPWIGLDELNKVPSGISRGFSESVLGYPRGVLRLPCRCSEVGLVVS